MSITVDTLGKFSKSIKLSGQFGYIPTGVVFISISIFINFSISLNPISPERLIFIIDFACKSFNTL